MTESLDVASNYSHAKSWLATHTHQETLGSQLGYWLGEDMAKGRVICESASLCNVNYQEYLDPYEPNKSDFSRLKKLLLIIPLETLIGIGKDALCFPFCLGSAPSAKLRGALSCPYSTLVSRETSPRGNENHFHLQKKWTISIGCREASAYRVLLDAFDILYMRYPEYAFEPLNISLECGITCYCSSEDHSRFFEMTNQQVEAELMHAPSYRKRLASYRYALQEFTYWTTGLLPPLCALVLTWV